MHVLLSTIGSRGDVQPMLALALALKALGEEVRLCVPPDFREWIESLGLTIIPIGPELRRTAKAPVAGKTPTPEQRRRLIENAVATQFETIAAAAQDCDIVVGATALQIAAPSVAERMGIPYVFTAYCPAVLPSARHAPPVLATLGDTHPKSVPDYSDLWSKDAARWNVMWRDVLNSHRIAVGLAPIHDVRSYVLTDKPWLAADAALAPWPHEENGSVFQTGAWILEDNRPLSKALEAFLQDGEPPVYFGFGSIRAPHNLNRTMIDAARKLGRRVVISRGWADLAVIDEAPDCMSIGDVNHQALFQRVAAVVHHGGAGTTSTAARAGVPQVLIPQHYDQHYWAGRVFELGIGVAHSPGTPTCNSLVSALREALQAQTAERARSISKSVSVNGAHVAARAIQHFG